MTVLEKLSAANQALSDNHLDEARRIVAEAESDIQTLDSSKLSAQIRANLGGLMIDLGDWTKDESLVERGTQYVQNALPIFQNPGLEIVHSYNAGNGHASLWKMRRSSSWANGRLDSAYLQAKSLYRQAIHLLEQHPTATSKEQIQELFVNYANLLDSHARSIEAIEYYDRALALNPSMGQALGNKGMALFYVSRLMRGYRHLFLEESRQLLEQATKVPLYPQMAEAFRADLKRISQIIDAHEHFQVEKNNERQPKSKFQKFFQNFCVRHRLFLTPALLLGMTKHSVYADPMFISQMVAPLDDKGKFPRYVTFLNQIKQDYVLARYFLVQSQYKSDVIDEVDDGVALYYPLDYSFDGAYIHLLKTSMRLALDVLDKIAYFIRDYCNVSSLADDKVNFRNVFSARSDPDLLRGELQQFKSNPFIFAIFDLARELAQGGFYSQIYEKRNALTHRFLVVHDMIVSDENPDIPRVSLNEFQKECIIAMQIARAAVMYLILLVDSEESAQTSDKTMPLPPALPVDDVLRWKPIAGERSQ